MHSAPRRTSAATTTSRRAPTSLSAPGAGAACPRTKCRNNCGTSRHSRDQRRDVRIHVRRRPRAQGRVYDNVEAAYQVLLGVGTNEDSCLTGCEAGEMPLAPRPLSSVENALSRRGCEKEERDEITDTHMARRVLHLRGNQWRDGRDSLLLLGCMTVINMCIDKCASHNECCNNDFMQAPTGNPLACRRVGRDAGRKECLETCPTTRALANSTVSPSTVRHLRRRPRAQGVLRRRVQAPVVRVLHTYGATNSCERVARRSRDSRGPR